MERHCTKQLLFFAIALVLLCGQFAAAAQGAPNGNNALEKVLNEMDAAAANFKTAQATFVWDQYTKVVDDLDTQKGAIYFRRQPKEMQMAADVTEHNGRTDKKHILYTDSSIQVFQPSIDQITKYNVGKNRAEVESFLVLGFGGRGHDLSKSFDVKYLKTEKVDNIEAAMLELTPKSASVRNNFNRIILWIDPVRGVSVRQQFFSPAGDYRLAKYSNIRLNEKIPDDAFKIKKTQSTKIVTP
jgi:outer membrane lipoprotein-sorting protein